jgi:hypothetical protein
MNKEICGYSCTKEIHDLQKVIGNLRAFYTFNPEYARRMTNQMRKILDDFDVEMYNKYENKFETVE